MDIIDQVIFWISTKPQYAGYIIFFVSLAESLAVIGIIIPGVIILFGVGALIGSGVLNFWEIYVWALSGAIIGDAVSYHLGRFFDPSISKLKWFRQHPEYLKNGYDFFEKWGDLSIVIGRFFGPVRAIIPFVAGLMKMSVNRFYLANVISAFAWALAYLIPGILFGKSSGINNLGTWLIILLALFIVVGLLLFIKRYLSST